MNDSYEINVDGWLFRVQPPADSNSRQLLLAIHGRTGNQFSMDIFTQKLKNRFWVIFPCAPFPDQSGGFSWIHESGTDQEDLHSLDIAARNLHSRINTILHDRLSIKPDRINMMGFSQGSAVALLYSLNFPIDRTKIALLSGFLPEGMPVVPNSLKNQSYFIAHGKQDTVIPVVQAHRLTTFIQDSGGDSDLCVADTGHKLGKDCFARMQDFLS